MSDFNWTCPHCSHTQTVTSARFHREVVQLDVGVTKFPRLGVQVNGIACANRECRNISVLAFLGKPHHDNLGWSVRDVMAHTSIWPEKHVKPHPSCIPDPIFSDYAEACKILELSPKASATLLRRCVQGMIRDFCGITKNSLFNEIQELEKLAAEGKAPMGVSAESVEAIHHLRKVGNIGAHMERDTSVIIDVEPEEAEVLVEFVELLFAQWYTERDKRTKTLEKLKAVADSKIPQQNESDLPAVE